jgi:hypothetical protein
VHCLSLYQSADPPLDGTAKMIWTITPTCFTVPDCPIQWQNQIALHVKAVYEGHST